GALA
ncbi:hypothetical protein D030_1336B, partial [Vibrio parahaemolyticus AQ3810]